MSGPPLHVLWPDDQRGELPPDAGEDALLALTAPPAAAGRAWTVANMIATVDGAATGPDGRTGSINGPADLRVFRCLRTHADVVLVGATTVRSVGYADLALPEPLRERRRADGRTADPAAAVVTRTGDLPDAFLAMDPAPWVLAPASCPRLPELRRRLPAGRVLVTGTSAVDLGAGLAALRSAGVGTVLSEGGPRLLGELLSGGHLDELWLTTAPLVGGGPAPRVVDATPWIGTRAAPALVLLGDAMVLTRWALDGGATRG